MFVGNGTNALELPGPTQRNSPLDVAKDPTILALLKYGPRGKYMCQLEKINNGGHDNFDLVET